MELNKLIGISALLYSLSNPVGVTPIFLSLTKKGQPNSAPRVIAVAAISVALLLVTAALLGQKVLLFFNVGLDDFRIAGGLLALFIAFEMFQARYGGFMQTTDERTEAEQDIHGIAVTPLAFPLLVGPAEMSIMITLAADRPAWPDKLALVGVSVLTALMIAITLFAATPLNRLIGKTGINVATRIMALFVAAIGVNFIFTGIRAELPGLLA
ncbi:MarC family protein [Asticcacaulis sp.]|uniref:MarC family protein n=1 Tax=Asticcacaulis sp. TaxID=1872648 RepID=UPI003F7C9FD5